MPSFEYRALTQEGKEKKGFLEADSERGARQLLRDDGYVPLDVYEGEQKPASRIFHRSVSAQKIALFARQLATLVDAGVPLEEALTACADQMNRGTLRKVILAVRSRVREGHTLAKALAEHPYIFSHIFIALVSAGEHSGHLAGVLNRLAGYLEDGQAFKATIKQGLAYPLVLCVVAILVVATLMSYVVPKVVAQFTQAQQELPYITELLIMISSTMQQSGMAFLVCLLGLIALLRYALSKPNLQYKWHHLLLQIPLVGRLIVSIDSARLMRTLSILTSSGVPLLDGLKVGIATVSNRATQSKLRTVVEEIEAGKSLYKSFEGKLIVPPIALYMIANGEKSGELDAMLARAAQHQEDMLEQRFKLMLSLFEPLLIVVLGAVVLVIVLAILLPILQLNNFTPV